MRGLGEGGLIRAEERPAVNAAYSRLLLICAAFAAGETAASAIGAYDVGSTVGLVLAVVAYVLTQEVDRPRRGRGELKYWRGRRVDDREDGPRRLN